MAPVPRHRDRGHSPRPLGHRHPAPVIGGVDPLTPPVSPRWARGRPEPSASRLLRVGLALTFTAPTLPSPATEDGRSPWSAEQGALVGPQNSPVGETEAGAGFVVPSRRRRREGGGIFCPPWDRRHRCTFQRGSWGARHSPRRFPRIPARHGAARQERGRGAPARRSHIRAGGSPFPGIFQNPSGDRKSVV